MKYICTYKIQLEIGVANSRKMNAHKNRAGRQNYKSINQIYILKFTPITPLT